MSGQKRAAVIVAFCSALVCGMNACTHESRGPSATPSLSPSPSPSPARPNIFSALDVPGIEFMTDDRSTAATLDTFTGPDRPFSDAATRYLVRPNRSKRLARLDVMTFKPAEDNFSLKRWALEFASGMDATQPRPAVLGGRKVWINNKPGVLTFVWWRFGEFVFLGTAPEWKEGRPLIAELVRQTRLVVQP